MENIASEAARRDGYITPHEVREIANAAILDLSKLKAVIYLIGGGLEIMSIERGEGVAAMAHIEIAPRRWTREASNTRRAAHADGASSRRTRCRAPCRAQRM